MNENENWTQKRRMPSSGSLDFAEVSLTPTPPDYHKVLREYPRYVVNLAPCLGTPWEHMEGTPDQWPAQVREIVSLTAYGPHVARDMADVLEWAAHNLRRMADEQLRESLGESLGEG